MRKWVATRIRKGHLEGMKQKACWHWRDLLVPVRLSSVHNIWLECVGRRTAHAGMLISWET